jgi:hypothetical protein
MSITKARAIPYSSSAVPLAIATVLIAVHALGTAPSAFAQAAPTEAAVRDFLENSVLQMRLEEGGLLMLDTDTIEFLPAAPLMPGGGILVTRDLAEARSVGAPHEPLRWSLRHTGGAPSLSLIVMDEGEPVVTIEGPLSGFDGERVDVELRGSAPGPDGVEQIVVRASLIALERLAPGARDRQREALAETWTLQRLGEQSFDQAGMPPVTYTFAPDGTFVVGAEGGLGTDLLSGRTSETLRGHWVTTGKAWTRPPLEGDYEHGPLLILFGDEPVPDVFMILEHRPDTLAIKNLAPWPLAGELSWITVHLRR